MASPDLADKHCEACVPGTPPITHERSKELLALLHDEWEIKDNKIDRTFEFRNFADAFALASQIAELAEQEGHHPDLQVGWGRLNVSLTTHVARGLTDNDFIMAAKIDKL